LEDLRAARYAAALRASHEEREFLCYESELAPDWIRIRTEDDAEERESAVWLYIVTVGYVEERRLKKQRVGKGK